MRADRSPEVGAENAPPVRASKGWAAGGTTGLAGAASVFLLLEEKGNMVLIDKKQAARKQTRYFGGFVPLF